ncbi:MAG: hypothetical protein V2A74_13215 [bacterium]
MNTGRFERHRLSAISLAIFLMISASAMAYRPMDADENTWYGNVRDGAWGLCYNAYGVVVGGVGAVEVLVGEVSVGVGDVLGLALNNEATRPVFQGFPSEIFAELGGLFINDGLRGYVVSNDLEEGPHAIKFEDRLFSDFWTNADDEGTKVWHTNVYRAGYCPFGMLGGEVVGGLLLKPIGNISRILNIPAAADWCQQHGEQYLSEWSGIDTR